MMFFRPTQMSDCQLYVSGSIPSNSGTVKYLPLARLCVLYNFYSHYKK